MEGWIKLQRRILDHWIWQDSNKLKWWIDMLVSVNHKSVKVIIKQKLCLCKRGQSIMSLGSYANRWNVSKDTVRNFFKLLEEDGMISIDKIANTTRITICNYEEYQGSANDSQTIPIRFADDAQTIHERSTHNSQTTSHTNNNDKKGKNEKNERSAGELQPPTFEEVKLYFKKNGYPESLAQRAFDYYSVNDWKDGKGRPVKNWKQKFISVWFKEENKTSTEKSSFGTPGLSIDKIK